MLEERLRHYRDVIDRAAHSARGKDVLMYLMFVCIAFVFWLFLSLDSEVQRDYDVPVALEDVPDSVTMLGEMPQKISVTVQGKGSQFLRFMWGKMPVMKVKFADNVQSRNIFSLQRQKIDSRMRDYFGQGVQITNVKPDSIRIGYTVAPGVKLPLVVNASVHSDLQYVITGGVHANIDSVKVFGVNGVPRWLTEVETEPLIRSGLKDTTRVEVMIKPIEGVRVIPDRVIVTIPVEPLISRRRDVAVEVNGLPEGIGLITFPAQVNVSYLVPMSVYSEDFPCRAYVDYNELDPSRGKLRVKLSKLPSVCQNVSVSPDSVEYIIEKKHL